jgi:ParB family transcriptional regulator, chromosome partitioning protein
MQVEIAQLELRYAGLRILQPARQARLAASLVREGQQTPVLVVAEGEDRFVLIDGYQRVSALHQLGRDLVEATVLPLGEVEALLMRFHLETTARRTALEDAWLLRELSEVHGLSQQQLAVRLRRSKSWVSGRLGLLRALPVVAQESVKQGRLPAHAAMKFLVPLARANGEHCSQLVANLGRDAVSVRQVERLYRAWRQGDAEQRERIVAHPWLFLKAEEAVVAADEPQSEPDENAQLLDELEGLAGLCRRVRKRVRAGKFARANPSKRLRLANGWHEARLSFASLVMLMREEELDAGPGDQNRDPAAAS